MTKPQHIRYETIPNTIQKGGAVANTANTESSDVRQLHQQLREQFDALEKIAAEQAGGAKKKARKKKKKKKSLN
jgi:hypothetical protein